MTRPTRGAIVGVAALLLAACGSGASDEPAASSAATDASTETPAPAGPDATSTTDQGTGDTAAPEPSVAPESAPSDGGAAAESAEPESPPTDSLDTDDGEPSTSGDDLSADEPGATTTDPTVEATMAWPDDGCSADNSPTPATSAEGPPPPLQIRTESADSRLPDLAVRRINCNGGWVNLKNELPSAQPLLIWMWAPH